MTLPGARLPAGAGQRVLTAIVGVPLFAWLVLRGPAWLFVALVLVVGALALWELLRLFEGTGQPTYARLGLTLVVLLLASFATPMTPAGRGFILSLVTAIVLSVPVWSRRSPATEPAALTLLGVLYVGWFLGHSLSVYRLPDGPDLILLLAGITWIGESAAYVVGSALGRHKLAPTVSPKKTIEGAVAQVVASILAGVGLAEWLAPEWSLTQAVVIAFVIGITGQVGDLAESAMKRSAGVKDAGGLIPGHGGVLDRIDGLLFNAPAFYYCVTLGNAT
jgi:phosphatidate cytidylyltransferase